MDNIKIGDWVTQYSKGFWQVVDIKPKYADQDYNLDHCSYKKGDLISTWVLMKKAFTPKMKFRIDSGYCDGKWCKPVSNEVKNEIDIYFANNPDHYKKFMEHSFRTCEGCATVYLQLADEDLIKLDGVMKNLPKKSTAKEFVALLNQNGMGHCIQKPPTNYCINFSFYPWDINDDFDVLFFNPKLIKC